MTGEHTDVRRTRAWRRLVRWAKLNLPWSCHLCGQRIPPNLHRFHPLSYALDHKLTVRDHPELALSADNVAPSHKQCNDWRKARPLSLGLLLECAERFAVRPPLALGFFGDAPISQQNVTGGAVETTERGGPPMTVIPSVVSPRSLSVTSTTVEPTPGAAVTQPPRGSVS